jgi:hypothetical protein
VPSDVKGEVQVVGLLEGWPFAVVEDPTRVKPKAAIGTAVLDLFRKVVEK